MNRITKCLLLSITLLLVIMPASSQTSEGGRIRLYGGKYNLPSAWFLGAGFEMGLLPIVTVIPSYEYVFTSASHYSTLNVDGVVDFLMVGYAGAGLGWNFVGSGGSSGIAFNLLGGIDLKRVPMSPFLQFKYIFFGQSGTVNTWMLGAGVHIGLR